MSGILTSPFAARGQEAGPSNGGGERTVLLAKSADQRLENVREALARSGMRVVGEALSAREAMDMALRHQPELCLLEEGLPGDVLSATREIFIALPDTRIALLVDRVEATAAIHAIRAGADGYLPKNISERGLINALTAMLEGEPAIPRALSSYFVRELRHTRLPDPRAHYNRLNRTLLYCPRFVRHLRHRQRSGMPWGAAWESTKVRMDDYRR